MKTIELQNPNNNSTPFIPEKVITKSGIEFNPREDVWSYRETALSINLSFSSMNCITVEFRHYFKSALVWYAENRSGEFLTNMFYRFRHLCINLARDRKSQICQISSNDLLNYYASLEINRKWYLSSLAGFLKKWYEFGIPGISTDVKDLLGKIKLKGNTKGVAVQTQDRDYGAFSDIELEAICDSLTNAFASGKIELWQYLMIWLFVLLGLRPAQLAALKVSDVSYGKNTDQPNYYSINIPRAKQRGGNFRKDFKNRIITPQIGELLIKHIKDTKKKYEEIFSKQEEIPLFPDTEFKKTDDLNKYSPHLKSFSILLLLRKIFTSLEIYSERTGGIIHVNARRFRYTIGTRAAAEGHGSLIIAELLDHTDTQNVGVYVQSSPGMIERIDRAMAMYMAPMAQAFAGTLIIDEAEAIRGNDPRSRIVDPLFDTSFKPIGNCGSFNFCGFAAPIACYTCRNFQPWLDGSHEAVLAHLLSERERLKSSADMRIASINDRTIFAVAQVITQCEQVRAEMSEGGDLG